MAKLLVEVTLTSEMLGTASANPELYEEFIASKRPAPEGLDEAAMLPPVGEEIERATTVFRRDKDGKPCLLAYQVKGFFKDACSMLRRADGMLSGKLKAYKKEIDGLLFITPEIIPIEMPDGCTIDTCVRPLRAQTAQGERVSLARSESVPAGSRFTFSVGALRAELLPMVTEWLDYGEFRGFGQWRNSGKGRFSYAVSAVAAKVS